MKVSVTKVEDIGENAFWVGDHGGASCTFSKATNYVRVIVSGAENDDIRLGRSKSLAQRALDRL